MRHLPSQKHSALCSPRACSWQKFTARDAEKQQSLPIAPKLFFLPKKLGFFFSRKCKFSFTLQKYNYLG